MKLTPAELKAELIYRYQERLGIICGDKKPTNEQITQANIESSEEIIKIKKAQNEIHQDT